MSVYTITNNYITVQIDTKGAELQSIVNHNTKLEYLWDGNKDFWGKKSPVLFPIVGRLKNNSYSYNGTTYQLSKHGFARDFEFEVSKSQANNVQFKLSSNENTLKMYPFNFNLLIDYFLEDNKLICSYTIKNTTDNEMYFSVGAHPAFALPIDPATKFEDWYLQFDSAITANIFPLTTDGLVEETSVTFLENAATLPLQKSLFYKDALVFKKFPSNSISILSTQTKHGLKFTAKGFDYYGIWSAKDANFICLEPWNGIADSVNTTGVLQEKEGIICLQPEQSFTSSWQVEVF